MSLPRPLMERFIAHLEVTGGEVAALERQLDGDDQNIAVWRKLTVAAHKLCGTAVSFGFPELGAAACSLETAILTRAGSESRAREALQEFRAALASAAREKAG